MASLTYTRQQCCPSGARLPARLPAAHPRITGSPGWRSDPGPRTASVPETTLHWATTQTASHHGLCPEFERRCPFQSSRLTPERPCRSPELNGTEVMCPFWVCGPRAWCSPALEARSASEQAWGSSWCLRLAARIPGTRGWPPFPAHSPPRGVSDPGGPSHATLSSHRNARGQSCSRG